MAVFLDEAAESLAEAADRLLALDRGNDPAAVEAAFRPIHSVKGNCAFFGLMQAKGLAHDTESVLDHLRHGRLVAAGPLVGLLLEAVDALRAMLSDVRAGRGEAPRAAAADALRARLRESAGDASIDGAGLAHAIRLAEEHWLHGGEAKPALRQALQTLIQHARSTAGFQVATTASGLRPALAELRAWLARALDETPDPAAMERAGTLLDQLAATCDGEAGTLATMLRDGWRLTAEATGFDDLLRGWLAEGVERLSALPGAQAPATAPAGATPAAGGEPAVEPGRTMRVSEERIDTFLRLVGELLVVADMLGHIDRRVRQMPGSGGVARDLRRALDTFNALSGQLQQAIMAVRKVPARPLLHKVPRAVRDVAASSGRRIEASIHGEEVEIDKRLLDVLDAPLLHLVRNACDHGIEPPPRRAAAGKPEQGTVRVGIHAGAASVTLTVEDDGGGIDPDRVRAAAMRRGLIPAGSRPDDSEALALIFASGLSTAERVSEVSGRGVGLDAVKRDIEAVGGTVSVTSRIGHGTRFTVVVPKQATTQIIGGYLVRAGGQLLVLPLDRVRETFRPEPDAVHCIPGGGRMIGRHGRMLPVLGLAERLGFTPGPARALVVVEAQRRLAALAVETVVGVQKVVVRPLAGLPPTALIAGAALMGDGSAALILAPDGLIDGTHHG
ncbi:MAG: hypothetical protein RLZZ127_1307 [Planctomycetota bacterium]